MARHRGFETYDVAADAAEDLDEIGTKRPGNSPGCLSIEQAIAGGSNCKGNSWDAWELMALRDLWIDRDFCA